MFKPEDKTGNNYPQKVNLRSLESVREISIKKNISLSKGSKQMKLIQMQRSKKINLHKQTKGGLDQLQTLKIDL